MTKLISGIALLIVFALMAYVGPSKYATVNLTAEDCKGAKCYVK